MVCFAFFAPQERLTQQKAEKAAKGQEYNSSYKPQRSKDEAKERRKAILSNIGEVSTALVQVFSSWLFVHAGSYG
jgi:hypothetical protein